MKFFHLADLHFGKMLHQIPLIKEDQPFFVEAFLDAVDRYKPDAVVMSGDIYDRRVPPPEAIRLFDRLLTGLAERDVYVFIIPGNHDSAVRLSHVSGLLASHKIYIAGELTRKLTRVALPDGDRTVVFTLMPYLFPAAVSEALGRDDLSTYDASARAVIEAQEIDPDAVNILAAHQNVLAGGVPPEHSGSETIIGGLGEIDVSAFDAFDYVALGHIHNAQKVGRDTVRYAGCPLYYDFSEINRKKDLTLVTVRGKGDIRIESVPVPLRHTLRRESGTLEELLDAGRKLAGKDACYIECILRDRHVPPHALEQLRDVYGDALIHVKREVPEPEFSADENARGEGQEELSLEVLFNRFYLERNQELPDGCQEAAVRKILEILDRHGSDYILDPRAVPEEESGEILSEVLSFAHLNAHD